MTDAGWASNKVSDAQRRKPRANMIEIADSVLQAEHARTVRIVKQQMGAYQRQREVEKNQSKRDVLAGSILACVGLLAALQRGRGGKG